MKKIGAISIALLMCIMLSNNTHNDTTTISIPSKEVNGINSSLEKIDLEKSYKKWDNDFNEYVNKQREIRKQQELQKEQEELLRFNKYDSNIPLSEDLQKYIYNLCQEKSIDYNLVLAIIDCESKFSPDLISYNSNGTYDSGLMQINSVHIDTIKDMYGTDNLLDPYMNITIGIDMVSNVINRYGEYTGLMAYNAGIYGMKQGYGIAYANKVLNKKCDYNII